MTTASTAAAPTMRPMTFRYAFDASHASCQRPRAAQADSGIRENITARPPTNRKKERM